MFEIAALVYVDDVHIVCGESQALEKQAILKEVIDLLGWELDPKNEQGRLGRFRQEHAGVAQGTARRLPPRDPRWLLSGRPKFYNCRIDSSAMGLDASPRQQTAPATN